MNNSILNFDEMKKLERDCKYDIFEEIVKTTFDEMVGENTPLFKTDVEDLWETYLENLPEDMRQHYNCNACKNFIRRYGNIVTFDGLGNVKSVLWRKEVPEFFNKSVEEMNRKISKSNIIGEFVSDERTLGTPRTGDWTHLSVKLPMGKVNRSRVKTANQIMAEKLENYRMLSRALEEYSIDTINTAVELLNTESLYRSEKCLGVANWLKELKEAVNSQRNSKIKKNIKWLYVAKAPEGFCHVRSSMIGTLLDDIQSGMNFESVSRRFAEKMRPSNYMRSQSAPTESAIVQAERLVEKLGIANSLRRRYARFEELPQFIWKNDLIEKKTEDKPVGIFSNISPKNKVSSVSHEMNLPTITMTWEKFKRTVLPSAKGLEIMLDDPNKLMALVTASDSEAENILQWDNTFSWYYHGGVDAEMKRRVEQAGGQYENNDIRCSLMWESYTDLDIHCITPNRREIYFGNKNVGSGNLDIDMNAGGRTSLTPVENIRWANGTAPNGRYKFIVDNYSDRNGGYNPFKVELEVNGQIFTYSDNADRKYNKRIFEFDYYDGQVTMITDGSLTGCASSDWNVSSNSFVKVNGITTSPNLWEDKKVTHSGTHVFFLLDGCRDLSEGKGRGFFNEMLKPDLREIRKTLEAYMANTPIEDSESANACGVGYSKENDWNLVLRVTSDSSKRLIKIDRWD